MYYYLQQLKEENCAGFYIGLKNETDPNLKKYFFYLYSISDYKFLLHLKKKTVNP